MAKFDSLAKLIVALTKGNQLNPIIINTQINTTNFLTSKQMSPLLYYAIYLILYTKIN